jgi:hypothetical protein
VFIIKKKRIKHKKIPDKKKILETNHAKIFFIVFGLAILFIIAVLSSSNKDLKYTAEHITSRVLSSNSDLSILKNGQVDENKLTKLSFRDYEELKELFDVDADFCVYLEDENGNLILIDGGFNGIGSNNIYVSGEECGSKIMDR